MATPNKRSKVYLLIPPPQQGVNNIISFNKRNQSSIQKRIDLITNHKNPYYPNPKTFLTTAGIALAKRATVKPIIEFLIKSLPLVTWSAFPPAVSIK